MQQSVVAELRTHGPTTFESLRWKFWDGQRISSGRLPQTWNTALDRAVKSLVLRRQIAVDSRPLENLEEWVAHYPNKTLDSQLRSLRTELLPHLVDWLRDNGPSPRFSRADNEAYVVSLLTHEQRHLFASKWQRLEVSLRKYYAETGDANAFVLMARGKQLFETAIVSTSVSYRAALSSCENSGLPQSLAGELGRLAAEFLPENAAESLEFKSYIWSIAESVPSHGHCSLSEEAKDALLERCPVQLSRLSGFKPATKAANMKPGLIPLDFDVRRRPQHSPSLTRLLDHSVFQRFRFLAPS